MSVAQSSRKFSKEKASQSTRNALKRIEMQKSCFYTFDRVAQSPSGEAQLYLPQVTPRVPRSVHAKFHADRIKIVVRRGILIYWIHTYKIQIHSVDPLIDGVLTYSIDMDLKSHK